MLYDRATQEFFKSQIQDLSSATRSAIFAASKELKSEMQRQTRQAFKRGSRSNGSFFKAFKVYNLPENVSQGAASYVRAGVPWLSVFEDGDNIKSKGKYLITLTKDGDKLGFPRISKGNTWTKIYNKYKKYLKIIPSNNGYVVTYSYKGKQTIVYIFTPQVRIRKRLSFYDAAEKIANQIPETINKLL